MTHPRAAYVQQWREANRDRYRSTQRRCAARVRARNAIDCRALKLLRGCMDCGYDENADALEFDHRDPMTKCRGGVMSALGCDASLRREIAKCDVVCANCHSIRTALRRKVA